MPRVLLCDCYLDQPGAAGNFQPLLGEGMRVVRPPHEPWQATTSGFDAIVISGSAASIVEPPPWEAALEQLVCEAAARDVPVLGVCFGHQVIARALFGPEAVATSATAELGWIDVRHDGDAPLFDEVPTPFRTFASHREEVSGQHPGMQVFASSADCTNQAFRIEGTRLWGVQFHSEIALVEATRLLESRAASQPALDVTATLTRAVDTSALARRIVANFLSQL